MISAVPLYLAHPACPIAFRSLRVSDALSCFQGVCRLLAERLMIAICGSIMFLLELELDANVCRM
jgi:hypothetical protein